MIFVLSQQAAASAFSGSNRACNLIFLGKPPLCGLGLVGGPAELCNGILSFCNILECDEILICPPDYILLHTFEDFEKNWTLPRSFPCSLKLPSQPGSRGSNNSVLPAPLQLCILPMCMYHLWKLQSWRRHASGWDTNGKIEQNNALLPLHCLVSVCLCWIPVESRLWAFVTVGPREDRHSSFQFTALF